MRKQASKADAYVGERVRQRRTLMEINQSKLGEMLGISFQQIQKYEKGANRISAGRLVEIASALRAPIGYFFEGLPESVTEMPIDFPSAWALGIARKFDHIGNRRAAIAVSHLIDTLADQPASLAAE
jgi:transcriptional regulator with XRE-family HTH domain